MNYIAGNLLDIKKKYDYITWFLPFVVKEPHIYWGLPKKLFCPEKMLHYACSLLDVDGEMLIVNQGEEEARIQKDMLNKLNVKHIELGEIKSKYLEYKYKRFGYLIKNDY